MIPLLVHCTAPGYLHYPTLYSAVFHPHQTEDNSITCDTVKDQILLQNFQKSHSEPCEMAMMPCSVQDEQIEKDSLEWQHKNKSTKERNQCKRKWTLMRSWFVNEDQMSFINQKLMNGWRQSARMLSFRMQKIAKQQMIQLKKRSWKNKHLEKFSAFSSFKNSDQQKCRFLCKGMASQCSMKMNDTQNHTQKSLTSTIIFVATVNCRRKKEWETKQS